MLSDKLSVSRTSANTIVQCSLLRKLLTEVWVLAAFCMLDFMILLVCIYSSQINIKRRITEPIQIIGTYFHLHTWKFSISFRIHLKVLQTTWPNKYFLHGASLNSMWQQVNLTEKWMQYGPNIVKAWYLLFVTA